MKSIRIIGRNSKLSLLQMEIVRKKVEENFPGIAISFIEKSSRGDNLQDIPLQLVEGSDFFTEDIFNELETGAADIAVHSLKDMSAAHFFGRNHFAVVDRDDMRDIAIFNPGVVEKASAGSPLRIGTCSPRREEMALGFLRTALPVQDVEVDIIPTIIRGNVDTRLQKLAAGEYDGIILATAGLNRLLRGSDAGKIRELLQGKPFMVLPLVECVPAPCQGAIVAEAHPANTTACAILEKINDTTLLAQCTAEKEMAGRFGSGCEQRFGVTSLVNSKTATLYAAGRDAQGEPFSTWNALPAATFFCEPIFSSTDYMSSFFTYKNRPAQKITQAVVFVANYKALANESWASELAGKQVWASGTKTWMQLARKGVWVSGSADAMGLAFMEEAWKMPLLAIDRHQVAVLTHHAAAAEWERKGWNAFSSYELQGDSSKRQQLGEALKNARLAFWTSFHQYEWLKDLLPEGLHHACASGETANRFLKVGISPLLFPTIKAFQQWRQECSQSTSAA